jgi:hypothetical protein
VAYLLPRMIFPTGEAAAVASQLSVVMSTTAQASVAVPASDARAVRVVPSAAVAHETTGVPGLSSHAQ